MKSLWFKCLFVLVVLTGVSCAFGSDDSLCFSPVSEVLDLDQFMQEESVQHEYRLRFKPRYGYTFMSAYGNGTAPEAGFFGHYAGAQLKSHALGLGSVSWFPDIDSRTYSWGYGQDNMSVGEQILYSLGMVLLQMTALELDRTINDRQFYSGHR
jgi:hypothetical protein